MSRTCASTARCPTGSTDEVDDALARLEELAGKQLGDDHDPLLLSVRSGARDSMPGMLDTVLNLGLNDRSVEGLTRRTGNERFAWDSYRRFVQMFGNVVRGIPSERFEDEIARAKRERGVTLDTDLDAAALRELTERFQAFYEFPADPREQLIQAIRAVFESWVGHRAVEYRRIKGIPDEWGTAVNVQQMVFGNKGKTSGSGVAFSRDEITGAPSPSGDFLPERAGRGRRVRCAHPARHLRARGMAARGPLTAHGHAARAGAPLQGHAGHGVHRGGRSSLHAPNPQRQASCPGGGALCRGRRGRRAC